MKISKKRMGFRLQMKSVEGQNGSYLFIKNPAGSYHAFIEVATKDAIRDCGIKERGTTRQLGKKLLGF